MKLRDCLRRAEHTPGRWLMWCALGFTLSTLAACYVLPDGQLLPAALLCAMLILPCLALRGNVRVRAVLLCLFAALGFARYAGYLRTAVAPAEALAGETRTVQARVTDFPIDYGTYRSVTVRLTGDGLPEAKAVFYDYDNALPEVSPGDEITGEVRLISAATAGGESTSTFLSKGITLRGSFTGAVTVTGKWSGWYLYVPAYVSRFLQNACDTLFPERTALFVKALITGDKVDVYDDPEVYADLSQAGILHVMAVSGMHVAFLVTAVTMLTGTRRGLWICILLIAFFAVMTGLSPSVLRAGLMESLFLLAPALRREADGVTSLSFALLLLLVWNPCSIGSASLQLSFAAMAGLLLLTPRLAERLASDFRKLPRFPARLARFITASVSASVGATVFSLPLSAAWFGYVPLYGVLTNLLTLWLVPACFIGGFLACVLGTVFPALAPALGTILSVPVEIILRVSAVIAALPYSALYLSGNHLVWWLAGSYVLFLITYLRRGDQPYRPFFPVCLSVSVLCLLLIGTDVRYDNTTELAAVDVGQGQSIVLLREGTTVVIDCGGDSAWSGDDTAAFLLGRRREQVDLLVLTHLHADHVNGVTRLMTRVDVDRLLLLDCADDEDRFLADILAAAERHGTQVYSVSETCDVSVGNISLSAYVPPYKGENQGLILRAELGDASVLITGDADETAEKWLVRSYVLPDGDILVAGHHGAGTSTSRLLLETFSPEQAVISVGYNPYGHPAAETLDRLAAENVVVYRTDTFGDIELRLDDDGEEGNT